MNGFKGVTGLTTPVKIVSISLTHPLHTQISDYTESYSVDYMYM